MPLTAQQQALADAIGRALEADAQIEAAWLAGSLGRGGGDAFSDVDVLALVASAPAGEVAQRWSRDVAKVAEPVLVNLLYTRVVSVVTADWGRFDVSFVEAGDLARYDAARLTTLFNRGDRTPPTVAATAPYQATPETVLPLVNEFFRVLGLLVVAVGREEWLLSQRGGDILRTLTVDLMLEENGVSPADRGGALSRNPLLTADQRRELEALTPLAPNRASCIAGSLEIAVVFLPRARRLATRIGMTWPSAFEDATRRHLRDRLGIEIA